MRLLIQGPKQLLSRALQSATREGWSPAQCSNSVIDINQISHVASFLK